jgi:diguanylate cyclase (GGDEF)-like protein/PAS domain S-box-containing protein
MSGDSCVELASPRTVHIVDATNGPLVGEGRMRRMMPFAITASISVAVAVPTTTWTRPDVAVVGSIFSGCAIIGALTFPWHRTARVAQMIAPFLFLAATLLLTWANGHGIGSPFISMTIMPLMWLALYESRTAVVSAAVVAGVGLWLATRGGTIVAHDQWIAGAVFVVCGIGMGVTLHGLVADSRKLALSLSSHQLALEHAAVMLDALPERVNRYRISDLAITYCNAAWATQYNIAPHDALGRPLDQFLSDDETEGLHTQLALLGPDNPVAFDTVARSVQGAPDQWLEWADRYLMGADGPEVLSVGRDVTGRRDAEIKLAESEARFRDLADKSADVVWRFIFEPTPHFDYISPSVENILGYPPSYFLEDFTRMLDILDDDGRAAIERTVHGSKVVAQFDFHFHHADGSLVVGETRAIAISGGLQGVSRDVTELRRLQESMAALALHDPLTGLANRRLFRDLLDAGLARTQRNGLPLAVAFVDLDDFKNVNDSHGHDVGDLVLCETARRLVATVRGTDTVARFGGDEFVIVFDPNDVSSRNIVDRIDRALAAPIYVTLDMVVTCPASIGSADTRTIGYNAEALITAADQAMYEVKRARRLDRVSLAKVGAERG